MKVRAYGVRGSTPTFGPSFTRVGGHTSCLAVTVDEELPTLVLDAGTGLQSLAEPFMAAGAPFVGTILCTHLHWDHVQGLPFFPPADREDADVTFVQPAQGDPVEVMSRAMSPPHFPIGPMGLRGTWKYLALEAGDHDFPPFRVRAVDVEHKGGRAFGYRVSHGDTSFAYVPDALDDNDDAILELATDVDCLIRGTPFVAAERERAELFGHGTVEHAVQIARRARARQLVLTHHGPMRDDDAVEKIAAKAGAIALIEGMTLTM